MLNNESRKADKEWSSSFDDGQEANNSSPLKCTPLRDVAQGPRNFTDYFERPRQRNMDIRYGTWKIGWDTWIGCIWLRIGTSGELL
jgi:hypothetical protein